jgi:yecA family protein
MHSDRIRVALEQARDVPHEALRAAVRESEALLPAVLEVLGIAKQGVHLLPRQRNLLIYGLHAMAAARRGEICRPFVGLLHEPLERLEDLLGGAIIDSLPRIVVSVFDGDAAPLIAAIDDRTVDGYVRWGLLDALAQLAIDGAIARDAALATLDRFERDRLAADGDPAWAGWENAALRLAPGGFAERIRTAWSDGRSPKSNADQREVEMRLGREGADPAATGAKDRYAIAPIDDPAEEIELDLAMRLKRRISSRVPASRDPAQRVALDAAEIDWLDAFLFSPQAPEKAMTIEEIDGFFVGLQVGPEGAVRDEHLAAVWGGADGPAYDSPEQAEYVQALLARHWSSIAMRLNTRTAHRPLIDEQEEGLDGSAWAVGFLRGVRARRASWTPLMRDENVGPLLDIVLSLVPPLKGETEPVLAPAERERVLGVLPATILAIHQYLRPKPRERAAPSAPRRKVGRNDPCPCGSGAKFKRCCAALAIGA